MIGIAKGCPLLLDLRVGQRLCWAPEMQEMYLLKCQVAYYFDSLEELVFGIQVSNAEESYDKNNKRG